MIPTSPHNLRLVLIPWVIALVALFGVKTLVPEFSLSKKSENSHEIRLCQKSQHGFTPSRESSFPMLLAPISNNRIDPPTLPIGFLKIELQREFLRSPSPQNPVQGRAPPAFA